MPANGKREDSWRRAPHEITMINTLQAAQPSESNYRISITGCSKMIQLEYFMEQLKHAKLAHVPL